MQLLAMNIPPDGGKESLHRHGMKTGTTRNQAVCATWIPWTRGTRPTVQQSTDFPDEQSLSSAANTLSQQTRDVTHTELEASLQDVSLVISAMVPGHQMTASWPRSSRHERDANNAVTRLKRQPSVERLSERSRPHSEPLAASDGGAVSIVCGHSGLPWDVVPLYHNECGTYVQSGSVKPRDGEKSIPCMQVLPGGWTENHTSTLSTVGMDENMNFSTVNVPQTSGQQFFTSLPSPFSPAFIERPQIKHSDSSMGATPSRSAGQTYLPSKDENLGFIATGNWLFHKCSAGTFNKNSVLHPVEGMYKRSALGFGTKCPDEEEHLLSTHERSPVHPTVHTLPRYKGSAMACSNTAYVFVPITLTSLDLEQGNSLLPSFSSRGAESVDNIRGGVLYSNGDLCNNENSTEVDVSHWNRIDNVALHGQSDPEGNHDYEENGASWSVDQEVAMVTCPEEELEEEEMVLLEFDGEGEVGVCGRPGNPVADTLDGDHQ